MLYNRSNTLKSLEWVIMDEIHYLNDAEVCLCSEEELKEESSFSERLRLGRSVDHAA